MRIAQIAPLAESVPPKLYGGTERVVSWLTDELVGLGHDVTLFASGDSRTRAKLVPVCPRALRLHRPRSDPSAVCAVLLEAVAEKAGEFDVIHSHIDWVHLPLLRRLRTPFLTTLHGRLDLPDLPLTAQRFADAPFVSISQNQRAPLPGLNWLATIHHGLPPDLLKLSERSEGYLAFLGRIAPEKGPDVAIRVAHAAKLPLRIAAKVPRAENRYFNETIKPLLDQNNVEFVGEVNDRQKQTFLGNAAALLFPIDWPEPFGLVMIEAMACGTPVIAWSRGSVPEVIEDGVTGLHQRRCLHGETCLTSIVIALVATCASAQAQQRGGGSAAQIMSSIPANSETITHWYKQSVYDPNDSKIGEIEDVLVDRDGKMTALIIGVGGFLGMGEKDVAVPFNAVQVTNKNNNKWYLVMNSNKDALKSAKGFKYDRSEMKWIPE